MATSKKKNDKKVVGKAKKLKKSNKRLNAISVAYKSHFDFGDLLKDLSVEEIRRAIPLKVFDAGLEPEIVEAKNEKPEAESSEQAKVTFPLLKYDPSTIRVAFRQYPIDLLLKRMTENALDLNPGYQRASAIWDSKARSRLIESLLIKIPLPVFYIDSSDEDRWAVIDGSQRLSTFKAFALEQSLKLTSLEFLPELEGMSFSDLPRNLQRRFLESYIGLYLIEKGTPREVKLSIYERINTGGSALVPQEIRHAIFQGKAASLLEELVGYESFKLATNEGIGDLRMADRECVLRFLAFYLTNYKDYQTRDMDKFLHSTMAEIHKMHDYELMNLRTDFDKTMKLAYAIFGKDSFRKPVERAQVNKALFETWSSCLSKVPDVKRELLISKKKVIKQKFKKLMEDEDFVLAISAATGDVKKVQKRFAAIEGLINEVIRE
jgi:hypothetical protein